MTDTGQQNTGRADEAADELIVGESRWPMAGAVFGAMILTLILPDRFSLGPPWFLPALEAVLLVALVAGDPGRIDRRSSVLRGLSIALVAVLTIGSLYATVRLVAELITGGSSTNSASALLSAGATVWACNILAFSLLYWELDGGGAAQRAHRMSKHLDIAFPQQLNLAVAPPDWRPVYVDYLYLGFTAATAFSPTDAMPLTRWPKMAMLLEALVSLVVLGLVVARAVNVFT